MTRDTAELRIHLTGSLRVEIRGAVVEERRFPGRLGRLAFAYLADQHDRPVPRDELAEVLWEGDPPATWEKGTVVLVSKLRSVLADAGGREMLTNAYGCYQLSFPPGTWVDTIAAAEAAQLAERALDRGDAAEAVRLSSAAAAIARESFLPGDDSAWATGRRTELRQLLLRALTSGAEGHLRLGEPRRAVTFAAEAVRAEPFRESGYVLLMRAHAAAGDRGEALRVHEECRRLLSEELGVDPSPATEAAHLEILKATAEPAHGVNMSVRAANGSAIDSAATVPGQGSLRLHPARPSRRIAVPLAGAALALAGAVTAIVAVRHDATGLQRTTVPAAHTAARISPDGSGFSLVSQVGDRPNGIVVIGPAVWVIDYGGRTLTRIDAQSGAVLRTEAVGGAPTGIAAGNGGVWVTTAFGLSDGTQGSVQRFDAATGAPAAPLPLGDGVTGIAVGSDAVWVTDAIRDSLLRIDPLTGAVTATIRVGRGPAAVVVTGGSAWVANGLDGTVSRIDLTTQQVAATVAVPDPAALAAGDSSIWVASAGSGTLTRVDAATGATLATIPVGSEPIGVAAGPGGVWVAVAGAADLVHVDAGTNRVTATLRVDGRPAAIAAAGDAVWTTVEGS